MSFTETMFKKALSMNKSLVLPEGTEPRTIKAARIIRDKKLASSVTLIGKQDTVMKAAGEAGVNLEGIAIVNPESSSELEDYASKYYELRKHKGITLEAARETIQNPLNWGAMMVKKDCADAMVAGAENSTGKVLVAGFTIIGTTPGVQSASSCMVMEFSDTRWGQNGMMVFSDCATIPNPTAEQLAEITIASAESFQTFIQTKPIVAMLSFSTKGSASHPMADKVLEALHIVKERAPNLMVDGELQLDAAIIQEVGKKKAPESSVAGQANTLIFPDLQSGNIGYKIAQRFAGANAYGPFLQGFAKPISDLSRGASVDDIVSTCAVTLTQAG